MPHLVIRGDLIILLVKPEQAEWRHILWHYFNSLTPTQRSSIVLPYFFRIDNNSYLCGMNLAARSPNIGLPIWVSDSWNIEMALLPSIGLFSFPPWLTFSCGRLSLHLWRPRWTQSCQRRSPSEICGYLMLRSMHILTGRSFDGEGDNIRRQAQNLETSSNKIDTCSSSSQSLPLERKSF